MNEEVKTYKMARRRERGRGRRVGIHEEVKRVRNRG